MKKTFFNNCSALLRKSSKVLIISALSIFYFSNVTFAQCDDCDVIVTNSFDPKKRNEVELTSPCTNSDIIHEWTVSSQKCGNNLGSNPWLGYGYGPNTTGNVIRLYNVYMEGLLYTLNPFETIDCEYVVIHCMYRKNPDGTKGDLICCSDPIQL
jgi:hypothetical protein